MFTLLFNLLVSFPYSPLRFLYLFSFNFFFLFSSPYCFVFCMYSFSLYILYFYFHSFQFLIHHFVYISTLFRPHLRSGTTHAPNAPPPTLHHLCSFVFASRIHGVYSRAGWRADVHLYSERICSAINDLTHRRGESEPA